MPVRDEVRIIALAMPLRLIRFEAHMSLHKVVTALQSTSQAQLRRVQLPGLARDQQGELLT